MIHSEQETIFRKALAAYRAGNLRDASILLQRLLSSGSTDPRHLSYCGLVLVTFEGRTAEGRRLCERAEQIGFYDPQIYINLARVYQHLGWRTEAIHVLRRGLRVDPAHVGLQRMIEHLNPRRKPPLGFLRRSHFLNRYLGKMRHQFLEKRRSA